MNVYTKHKFTAAYIAAIPITNWLFGFVGLATIPGTNFVIHPLAVLVGGWLVLRDFAHKELGDRAMIGATLVGIGLSFLTSEPRIATASAIAFAASEAIDYIVYRSTDRPFEQRILLSSAVSVPVDSVLFTGLAFGLSAINPVSFTVMLVAKMAGAVIVAGWIWRRR